MIVIGYQGIGKSTLAKGGNGFIDLESGNFWVDGVRDEHWAQAYANIAVHLSMQGYDVFTSSHEIVRQCLKTHPDVCDCSQKAPECLAVCYPVLELREPWVKRLRDRYDETKKEKDYKAWINADKMYEENIRSLMAEELPVIQIPITSMDYDLFKVLSSWSITGKKGQIIF